MLTSRQKQLYDYLCSEAREGRCPSYREMAVAIGLSPKTKAYVRELVDELAAKGLIRRLPNRVRAIEVLPAPARYEVGSDRFIFIPAAHLCFTPLFWNPSRQQMEVRG